ncbi:type II toxin-antitoxin system HicA family toxin [Marinomonas arenicola]|uniref:type II toxin-antitoxin system HicA family toxin n=1 Tax=Marinomonas TaxID=28253 RepID=UPI00311F447E
MGKHQRAKEKIFKVPTSTNLTWKEASGYLESIGFTKIEGDGSRIKYFHEFTKTLVIIHKPHPGNELKEYLVRQIREHLKKHEAKLNIGS